MGFYISIVILISILLLVDYFNEKKLFHLLEKVALFLIISIIGLRYETGYDYHSYTQIYEGLLIEFIEPGFIAIQNFLKFFGASHYVMFYLFSFGTCTLFYLGIKKYTQHSRIALLIFLLIPGLFLNTFSVVRQQFSISLAFYAFFYLKEKRYAPYITFMLIAISIHFSCIIILFIHLFVWKYIKIFTFKSLLFLLLVSIAFTVIDIGNILSAFLIGSKYAYYLLGEPVKIQKLLLLNTVILFYLFYYNKLLESNEQNIYIIVFSVLAIVILNVFSSFIFLTRLSYYFKAFEIVLVAEFIYLFGAKKRLLILSVIVIYYFSIFTMSLKNDMESEDTGQPKLIPYRSVFELIK